MKMMCALPLLHARATLSALLLLVAGAGRCQDEAGNVTGPAFRIPYDLARPTLHAKLPRILDEISGLAILDSARVAAVQDEDGVVFVLDARSGELLSQHSFGSSGDYEGVEAVAGTVFVLRSDGKLFELRRWQGEKVQEVVRHDTPLTSRYDTEGLALSPDSSHLLLACKEYPGKGHKGNRAIYRFSLESRSLLPEPALLIDARKAEGQIPEGAVSRAVKRMLDISRFKPSGLALHPVSRHVYVISSVARSLTVFDEKGDLLGIARLDKKLLPQPEGIAFAPGGDLLVASEGDGGRAHLARFSYLAD